MKKADEDVFVIPQEKENSILDRLIGFWFFNRLKQIRLDYFW
jgi:hypothetical protein